MNNDEVFVGETHSIIDGHEESESDGAIVMKKIGSQSTIV